MKHYNEIKPDINTLTGGWFDETEVKLEGDPNASIVNLIDGVHFLGELSPALTKEDCEAILSYFKTSPNFGEVSVQGFNSIAYNDDVGSLRTTVFNTKFSDELTRVVVPMIKDSIGTITTNEFSPTDAFQKVDSKENTWELLGFSPLSRFMIYRENGKHYAHYDAGFIYPNPKIRTLKSVVIYLTTNNSCYTRFIADGQEEIPTKDRNLEDWSREVEPELDVINLSMGPVKGHILFFDHRLCHDVDEFIPSIEGEERIIIRTDLIYKLKEA